MLITSWPFPLASQSLQNKKMDAETIQKSVLILVLAVLFLLQVKTSLIKFFEGQVTQSQSQMPVEPLRFPVLTVCPGNSYKEEKFASVNMTPYQVLSYNFRLWPDNALAVGKSNKN